MSALHLVKSLLLILSICTALAACKVENKIEETSPLVGTYMTTVEDSFMAEITLRSDGVFTYMRVGKDIYDRAYGKWEQTEKQIILKAVKRYPNTWGGPVLTLDRHGSSLSSVIAETDVMFEQTSSFKESLRNSEELRKKVYAR